jgi:hypothetical protein
VSVTKHTDNPFAERPDFLDLLVRVAGGSDLKTAAKRVGLDLREVLGKCMADPALGSALQVAQAERQFWQTWDQHNQLQEIAASTSETAMNVSDLAT